MKMIEMFVKLVFISSLGLVLCEKSCYWNRKCAYDLFASKTPYESVRGDLRDHRIDCDPISLWSLHRHGNRNPSTQITENIKALKDKILNEFVGNRWTNCVQDIEDLKNWTWNSTLENSANFLTGIGYEELFELGRRIRHKYMKGVVNTDDVHFRATNEQRTMTSAIAFVHGLYDGTTLTNFTMNINASLERDDIIRPYENCPKYQEEVKNSQLLAEELAAYDSSPEFLAVKNRVQEKLDINYELTAADVYNLYELCRFERSWSPKLRSAWCSFFTDRDLIVLEYRDDVRHYYRNAYGSSINAKLGAVALKELYENFINAIGDNKKTVVSYFTHDTMLEMVFCALGLYRDQEPLRGTARNASRSWRTSETAAFATNFIAVLYRCKEPEDPTYVVQLLINEKPTALCPDEFCTWQQFVDIFQTFDAANLDFCTNENSDLEAFSSSGRSDTTPFLQLLTSLIAGYVLIN